MTNRPPSKPESSQRTALGFDEFIAILVAFSAIAGILFWTLARKDTDWNFNGVLSPLPTPASRVQPNLPLPSLTAKPESNIDSNFNALPEPTDTNVIKPTINPTVTDQVNLTPVLPTANVAPIKPTPQTPFSLSKSLDSSIESSPVPLVSPAKQKSTIPPPIAFNDLSADFWASRFINVLSARGIIKGFPDYSFRPNQPVNRAEFAAILQQAFNKDSTQFATSFKDVSAKFWATPAINRAIGSGFLKGYPNKIFKPTQKISRVQVLVALVSGLNLQEPANPSRIVSTYKDAQDIPQYANNKIATATVNGLVVNYPNQDILAPNKEATRAEVAAMVHQALVLTGRVERISSQSIVQLSQ